MSATPQIGGQLDIRFSDSETRDRYLKERPAGQSEQVSEEAPYLWSIIRGFAKIEQGIDRLIVATLVSPDASPELRALLSPVFPFDHRLRIVERLVKRGALIIDANFRQIEGPVGIGDSLGPTEAIRKAMGYRNRLVHEGVFMWVAGDDRSYQTSIWVDGPTGRTTAVPLVFRANGQPSLFDFTNKLAMALPPYFLSSMFTVDQDADVDAAEILNLAMTKFARSEATASERRAESFDKLVQRFAGS